MMAEMSSDKSKMKRLASPVIQLMKCDFKFHGVPLNGSLPANARCGSPYIRQRTALLKLTSKVIIEIDRNPDKFETIRQTADGETFVCAHFMGLDVRELLEQRIKNIIWI
jgi:ABC-type iron transport system FetAB ATPase subunit